MGMLPAMDLGLQAFLDMTNGTGGLRDEVKRLSKDGSIAEWTTNAVKGLSYVADGVDIVIRAAIGLGNGLDTSVRTIPAALAGLSAAMAAATGRSASVADPTATVAGLYRDLLGREAEAGGADFWSTLLSLGVSLETVRGDIMKSDEYQARVTSVASPAVAGTTAAAGSNAELIAELRALRQEVATMRTTSERQTERLIDSSDLTATTLSDAARGNRTLKTEPAAA